MGHSRADILKARSTYLASIEAVIFPVHAMIGSLDDLRAKAAALLQAMENSRIAVVKMMGDDEVALELTDKLRQASQHKDATARQLAGNGGT